MAVLSIFCSIVALSVLVIVLILWAKCGKYNSILGAIRKHLHEATNQMECLEQQGKGLVVDVAELKERLNLIERATACELDGMPSTLQGLKNLVHDHWATISDVINRLKVIESKVHELEDESGREMAKGKGLDDGAGKQDVVIERRCVSVVNAQTMNKDESTYYHEQDLIRREICRKCNDIDAWSGTHPIAKMVATHLPDDYGDDEKRKANIEEAVKAYANERVVVEKYKAQYAIWIAKDWGCADGVIQDALKKICKQHEDKKFGLLSPDAVGECFVFGFNGQGGWPAKHTLSFEFPAFSELRKRLDSRVKEGDDNVVAIAAALQRLVHDKVIDPFNCQLSVVDRRISYEGCSSTDGLGRCQFSDDLYAWLCLECIASAWPNLATKESVKRKLEELDPNRCSKGDNHE